MRALAATQKFLRRDTRENINLHNLLQTDLAHYLNLEGANVIIKGVSLALCRGVRLSHRNASVTETSDCLQFSTTVAFRSAF